MQDCSKSSALSMELLQSCNKPYISLHKQTKAKRIVLYVMVYIEKY